MKRSKAVPALWKWIKSHPIGGRYLREPAFRIKISLHISFFTNLLYAGMQIVSWYMEPSAWFVIMAAYYGILAVMRSILLRRVRRDEPGKNRRAELGTAKLCAVILLMINFVLTGAVMMILYMGKGARYSGVLIYVMALYTFYITIHAIASLIRYRKYKSPVMTVSKIISLSAALVSMLSLETAMLSEFGGMDARSEWLLTVLTGAGVSVCIVGLSVYMIVSCTMGSKEIKKHEQR